MTGLDPWAPSRDCADCGEGIPSGYVRCAACRRARLGGRGPEAPAPASEDGDPLDALRVLQAAGLVLDPAALNTAWAHLTGREAPDLCGACGRPGGRPYLEPSGTWHAGCVPSLWDLGGNPMTAPKCRTCGAPGGIPAHPSGRPQKAACRAHAPAWLQSYLHQPDHDRRSTAP